jgi:hypothetical protein
VSAHAYELTTIAGAICLLILGRLGSGG